jgi:hypothetical protein
MTTTELLILVHHFLDDHYGKNFDSQPIYHDPRWVGAFGASVPDRHTVPVMIKGERFFLSVERDINQ